VIPDKFILLKGDEEQAYDSIKESMTARGTSYYGNEQHEVINQAIKEYNMHIKGVQDAFKGFIYEYDCTGRPAANIVGSEIANMLRLRFKSTAPRRPPRVMMIGPPGSGKTTQAALMAKKYGMVHLNLKDMLKSEIQAKPHIAKAI
jgi:adenylate kinase